MWDGVTGIEVEPEHHATVQMWKILNFSTTLKSCIAPELLICVYR